MRLMELIELLHCSAKGAEEPHTTDRNTDTPKSTIDHNAKAQARTNTSRDPAYLCFPMTRWKSASDKVNKNRFCLELQFYEVGLAKKMDRVDHGSGLQLTGLTRIDGGSSIFGTSIPVHPWVLFQADWIQSKAGLHPSSSHQNDRLFTHDQADSAQTTHFRQLKTWTPRR